MLWLLRIDIHGPVYLFEKQQGSVFRSPMKNKINKTKGKKTREKKRKKLVQYVPSSNSPKSHSILFQLSKKLAQPLGLVFLFHEYGLSSINYLQKLQFYTSFELVLLSTLACSFTFFLVHSLFLSSLTSYVATLNPLLYPLL